ncbi:MAG TPA: indole-3-glycerol phosphate synthase TrpC [Mobilitalea sp.]|nr:indole-3-glycerol phosphate synthase TrpC [Mobilitalea sp.]
MILDKIAEATRSRLDKEMARMPISILKSKAAEIRTSGNINTRKDFTFEEALKAPGISFICEVKKASPSKGVISTDFPYLTIARDYEGAGAAAISVLTEPEYFKGANEYLTEISREVKIPVLRKDFTINEYQIYEAKLIGADAVLLICSLLEEKTIKRYINVCDELGLSALVEAHNVEEVKMAVQAGARIIGVNNRNLQTFEVDIHNSILLRSLVPKEILFVAESGIKTAEDVSELVEAGVDAILIGETLMRSENKRDQISYLRGKDN